VSRPSAEVTSFGSGSSAEATMGMSPTRVSAEREVNDPVDPLVSSVAPAIMDRSSIATAIDTAGGRTSTPGMASPAATRAWAKAGMVLMSLLISTRPSSAAHVRWSGRPSSEGRRPEHARCRSRRSPLQSQHEVRVDVLVSEEPRAHVSSRASSLARRPPGGSFVSIRAWISAPSRSCSAR